MHNTRRLILNNSKQTGDCVIYIMSRDQRAHDNFALLAAQEEAIAHKLPLVVVFNLLARTGERAYEHVAFMLRGLEETAQELKTFNIPFIMTQCNTAPELAERLAQFSPQALYFDFSPLHGPRNWAKRIAHQLNVAAFVIDTHNIIPVWAASERQEAAAYTFRPKVHKLLAIYLVEPDKLQKHPHEFSAAHSSLSFAEAHKVIAPYPKRGITIQFKPGEQAARQKLADFIATTLPSYAQKRNDMATDQQSNLSPYLHFGHIASLRVALEVLKATGSPPLLIEQSKMASAGEKPSKTDGMNALFEEMIVRKELSDNFCLYAKSYTSFESLQAWAITTLNEHAGDVREHLYSVEELTNAATHDEAWNAAQRELTQAGKIHGYMRMYWAKKILEWTKSPEDALRITIQLNDAYSIDGGDPNGYVGTLWAIGGLHDRPWFERPVFGKIRYMNEAGLRRKFKIDDYISRVAKL